MGGDVMMSVPDPAALRQAEILAMRQISDNLKILTDEIIHHRTILADVKQDVAVMKIRMDTNDKLAQAVEQLENRCSELELRNAKQDGAAVLMEFVYKFGPWLVALGGIAWGLLGHHAL